MQGCPTRKSQQEHLTNECPGDVTCIKVASQKSDRHKVDYESHDRTNDHFEVNFMNL